METNLELLRAWIKMSENIKIKKILENVSFNEMLIMSYIYENENATASAISKKTNLLKSQMNRSLNELEKKKLISRNINPEDKRFVYLSLTKQGKQTYEKEHKRVMDVISKVRNTLGNKKTKLLTNYLNEAIDAIGGK